LGSASLDGEIKQAVAPGLAASLRLTEEGRKQLADRQTDEAMRSLARAVSVDPGDAFAYYYLGRAHLQRKNYEQALTFFRRAEVGFSARPDWMAEALTYEGACDEELGRQADAIKAYQRALAASPNNLRARVGYGRLAPAAGPVGNLDAAPLEQDLSAPAVDTEPESAPSESPPPSADEPPEDQ
jgi:tetratricopeptide (TPR) repeat protein